MTDRSNDRASMVTLAVVLIGLTLGNFFFYEKWQQSEATIARQNAHLEQVVKDLTKEKSGVEATLAECNSVLAAAQASIRATVQGKQAPVSVLCPALPPAPVCPAAPACPPVPPAVICSPVPAEAAKIATPVPTPKEIHKHSPSHRRYRLHKLTQPECLGSFD